MNILAAAFAAFGLGIVAGLACWTRRTAARVLTLSCALIGALLLGAGGLASLSGSVETLSIAMPMGAWTLRLDPLSGWFLLALSILSASVTIYSFGYVHHMERERNTGAFGALYNLLILSLALVFTAADVFFFITAWEVMTVAAYTLITFEHERAEARRSAMVFLIMSHAGAALLLGGFLVLALSQGNFTFAALHGRAALLAPGQQGILFLLFFLGFGVKAGIVPLHVWLPDAHPVAPSNVSALMSGIVIKTGIYGMARVFFDFYGPAPLWTGTTVLAVGVVSALVGVLYALQEHDLKRLLAYHSIENIGIIVMGFGAAMMFRTLNHPALAAIALVAALYHTFNHATFKGLLFLSAGSVAHSMRTRNMEEMGGLIRRMPATGLFFLIGAVAISGLPPLNGFVSEWLTYQALLAGFGTTPSLTRLMFPISGSLLALTAALAAACFVKAFGIPFLALPRSEAAAEAHECGPAMKSGMAILAAACVALGLGASWIIPSFDAITRQTVGVQASSLLAARGFALQAGNPRAGAVSTAGIALAFLALAGLAALLVGLKLRRARVARGPAWDCGLPGLTAENEYTATAFSKPLRLIFSAFYRPHREIHPEYEVSPYYPSAIHFESEIESTFETRIYEPVKTAIFAAARRMRAVQAGSVHAYLAYIFVTLIVLLLFGVRP